MPALFSLSLARALCGLCYTVYDGDADEFAAPNAGVEDMHGKAIGDQFAVSFLRGGVRFIIIRGTTSLGGWVRDLEAVPIKTFDFAGFVHRGFYESFIDLHDWLMDHLDKQHPVQVTGHSLGGALATLASQSLYAQGYGLLAVYTFGSPSVGCADFARSYLPMQVRVVNDLDPVPHVPVGFTHVGDEWRLPGGGSPGLGQRIRNVLAHVRDGLGRTIVEAVNDHHIGSYVDGLAGKQEPLKDAVV